MTILEYFTGSVTDHGEKNRTFLQNLKCPILTYFRWYKDIFLSRICYLMILIMYNENLNKLMAYQISLPKELEKL